jgi:hypothetical protein
MTKKTTSLHWLTIQRVLLLDRMTLVMSVNEMVVILVICNHESDHESTIGGGSDCLSHFLKSPLRWGWMEKTLICKVQDSVSCWNIVFSCIGAAYDKSFEAVADAFAPTVHDFKKSTSICLCHRVRKDKRKATVSHKVCGCTIGCSVYRSGSQEVNQNRFTRSGSWLV